MSDHVRKFDWDLEKPQRKKAMAASVSNTQAQVSTPEEELIDQTGIPQATKSLEVTNSSAGTAPFGQDLVHDLSTASDEYKPTNPFLSESVAQQELPSHTPDTITPQHSSSPDVMIDPDTGLEIPEYMRPFLEK